VAAVLRTGWLTRGPRVERFETELETLAGVEHAVCLSSCTAGLELTLQGLKLRGCEEVIATPLTFCSTGRGAFRLQTRRGAVCSHLRFIRAWLTARRPMW
jgi:dTDP-4-amino-4,6-dideoxygalactose transaminase